MMMKMLIMIVMSLHIRKNKNKIRKIATNLLCQITIIRKKDQNKIKDKINIKTQMLNSNKGKVINNLTQMINLWILVKIILMNN